ncbi:hypothetical protein AGMMS49574_00480 [Bacteroidia bacterium]|nr:hypothetical protein AGMMS49574_00480 [Bacteroidia bacterium]
MKTLYFETIVLLITIMLSCSDNKSERKDTYYLLKSNKQLSFALDRNTKSFILALFTFTDENGKEYLTFQNQGQNEILFYDINSTNLEFKIKPTIEGANGVGLFTGYAIKNMDSIFLTNSNIQVIYLIDKNATVKDVMLYEETVDKVPLLANPSISHVYRPLLFIDDDIYIVPNCNRWAEKNPVCAVINMTDKSVHALRGLSYPTFSGADNKAKAFGVEEYISRCYNGKQFVYAFHFDEDIYITSIDHNSIKRVTIKSKYIDKVKLIDDYGNLTAEDICENPNYGNMHYDKYRDIYYRIAYPKTEIEKGIRGLELMQYGRKNFSIIILDKDFNIIGETLFPDYTYNSTVMFIREDGLYISSSHYLNPEFSDDILSFQRFDLVKE